LHLHAGEHCCQVIEFSDHVRIVTCQDTDRSHSSTETNRWIRQLPQPRPRSCQSRSFCLRSGTQRSVFPAYSRRYFFRALYFTCCSVLRESVILTDRECDPCRNGDIHWESRAVPDVPLIPASIVLSASLVAAVMDLWKFKVYNALTVPLFLTGLAYHFAAGGVHGLLGSLSGALFGFAVLIVAYAMGGMGAGDVKLMAAIGAWLCMPLTFYV